MDFTILRDAMWSAYQDYKNRDLNMAQLANDIGISRSMVNHILSGKRRPGTETLFRMYHHSEAMYQAVKLFFADGDTEVKVNDTSETIPEELTK